MGLFGKKIEAGELFKGMVDRHCHILPGVDDGFKTMEDSLSVLSRYQSLGVREVWLTPHVMEDVPNTPEKLQARFEELKNAMQEAGISIPVHLAAEHMIDNLFQERLRDGVLLPLGSKQLLVETSYFNPPMDFHATLGNIKSKGYFPVLAHPERYQYMDMEQYKLLKGMDVRFQLNLSSLVGLYGREAAKKAEKLLSLGYYDMIGTDLHREEVLDRILTAKLNNNTISKLQL